MIDYLPERDSLLHLRVVSRDINAKVSRRFVRRYFHYAAWVLGPSGAKAIVHFCNRPDIASCITMICLDGPSLYDSRTTYNNIWTAKSIDPVRIGQALSLCTQVDSLTLKDFERRWESSGSGPNSFLRPFAQNVCMPKLGYLSIHNSNIDSQAIISLQKNHSQTLINVYYSNVELLFEKDEIHPGCETPWADVLTSMKSFKNNCSVAIVDPSQIRGHHKLEPPWADWQEYALQEYNKPCYRREGMCIKYASDEPDEEDGPGDVDFFFKVEIAEDSRWWENVKRLATYAMFAALDDGLEDKEVYIMLDEYDDDDQFWDDKFNEFVAKKNRWAREARRAAAALQKKQKKGKTGAVVKK